MMRKKQLVGQKSITEFFNSTKPSVKMKVNLKKEEKATKTSAVKTSPKKFSTTLSRLIDFSSEIIDISDDEGELPNSNKCNIKQGEEVPKNVMKLNKPLKPKTIKRNRSRVLQNTTPDVLETLGKSLEESNGNISEIHLKERCLNRDNKFSYTFELDVMEASPGEKRKNSQRKSDNLDDNVKVQPIIESPSKVFKFYKENDRLKFPQIRIARNLFPDSPSNLTVETKNEIEESDKTLVENPPKNANDCSNLRLRLSEFGLNVDTFINDMSPNTKQDFESLSQAKCLKQEETKESIKIESDFSSNLTIKSEEPLHVSQSFSVDDFSTSKYLPITKATFNTEEVNMDLIYGSPEILKMFAHIYTFVLKSPNLLMLMSDDDTRIMERFLDLPIMAQYVCMRLFCRQAKWYPVHKFFQSIQIEKSSAEEMALMDTLRMNGFVETDLGKDSLEGLLNNLMKPELKILCTKLKMRAGVKNSKSVVIENILKWCRTQSTLSKTKSSEQVICGIIAELLGPSVKLNQRFWMAIFRIQLLYRFADPSITTHFELYQRIKNVESEDIIMPDYEIDSTSKVFCSSEEFRRYADAAALYFEYIEATERKNGETLELAQLVFTRLQKLTKNQLEEPEKPRFLRKFNAFHVYCKVLTSACKLLTKQQDEVQKWLRFLLANNKTSPSRGLWYNRLCIVHSKSIFERAQLLFESFHDLNVSDADRFELCKRTKNLLNSKNVQKDVPQELIDCLSELSDGYKEDLSDIKHCTIEAKQIKNTNRGKATYIYNDAVSTVEEVALLNYHEKGYVSGHHCEGRLMVSIFFMIFWDLIYEFKVPAAFVSPVQVVPLDMFSKDFYTNRREQIDERLKNVAEKWTDTDLYQFVNDNMERYGYMKSLHVTEYVFNKSIVIESIACIGREVLAKILRHLAEDFRSRHSGMPDLFVYNIQEKKCLFVEVKSQNDILSNTQILWLTFLNSVGAPAEVCHVKSL